MDVTVALDEKLIVITLWSQDEGIGTFESDIDQILGFDSRYGAFNQIVSLEDEESGFGILEVSHWLVKVAFVCAFGFLG